MYRAPYPAHLPHFLSILENVPGSIEQKAKLLDISPATLRRYRTKGHAPRSIHLALFWESVWGIQYIESISGLRTSTYFAQAKALERQNERLKDQIAKLEAEITRTETGPANLPIFSVG